MSPKGRKFFLKLRCLGHRERPYGLSLLKSVELSWDNDFITQSWQKPGCVFLWQESRH